MTESKIYLDDQGNYRDKGEDWTEQAPVPTEDGDGVQDPVGDELTSDGTGETLPDAPETDENGNPIPPDPTATKATAKTRKQ